MNSALIMCIAMSNCLYQVNAFAQEVTVPGEFQPNGTDSNHEAEIHDKAPGVSVSRLMKNAVTNADGSHTIKSGHQTSEANDLNRRFCQSIGANDVTNDGSVILGPGAIYGGVCAGPGIQRNSQTIQAVPNLQPGKIYLPKPNSGADVISPFSFLQSAPFQIVPAAINGRAPPRVQYYVNAAAQPLQ